MIDMLEPPHLEIEFDSYFDASADGVNIAHVESHSAVQRPLQVTDVKHLEACMEYIKNKQQCENTIPTDKQACRRYPGFFNEIPAESRAACLEIEKQAASTLQESIEQLNHMGMRP